MRRDERALEAQLVIELPDPHVAQIAERAGGRPAVVHDLEHHVRRVLRILRQRRIAEELERRARGASTAVIAPHVRCVVNQAKRDRHDKTSAQSVRHVSSRENDQTRTRENSGEPVSQMSSARDIDALVARLFPAGDPRDLRSYDGGCGATRCQPSGHSRTYG